MHYLMGLQANDGGIGLDCYVDLRLEVDTGSRHSKGPKQPTQTTGQSMENFIKQDLPCRIILRGMKRELSQGCPKQRTEARRFPGSAGPLTVPHGHGTGSVFECSPFIHRCVFPHKAELIPTYPRFLSSLPSHCHCYFPQTTYYNASRWAEVQLNNKTILPSQEGDSSGGHKKKWPWDHWLIWLPSRGQNAEDFQLLLRLKLTRWKRKKGLWAG